MFNNLFDVCQLALPLVQHAINTADLCDSNLWHAPDLVPTVLLRMDTATEKFKTEISPRARMEIFEMG